MKSKIKMIYQDCRKNSSKKRESFSEMDWHLDYPLNLTTEWLEMFLCILRIW